MSSTLQSSSSNMRVLLAVLLTVAILTPMVASSRAARAHEASARARVNLDETRSIADQLLELQHQSAAVGDRPSPEPDLVARLHNALHLTGVNPERLTRVNMQASQAIRGTELHKQAVVITVGPIRAPDLARCLNRWTTDEPLWTIRSIRLDRVIENQRNRQSAQSSAAPSDVYSASITLERIHLATSPEAPGLQS